MCLRPGWSGKASLPGHFPLPPYITKVLIPRGCSFHGQPTRLVIGTDPLWELGSSTLTSVLTRSPCKEVNTSLGVNTSSWSSGDQVSSLPEAPGLASGGPSLLLQPHPPEASARTLGLIRPPRGGPLERASPTSTRVVGQSSHTGHSR